MPRYIDAEALHKKIYPLDLVDKRNYSINAKAVEKAIFEMPTADVAEVVRCKDCKHRYVPTRCALWTGTIGEKDYFRYHGDEFYCSFGERKE